VRVNRTDAVKLQQIIDFAHFFREDDSLTLAWNATIVTPKKKKPHFLPNGSYKAILRFVIIHVPRILQNVNS
jgi:hypothetical protein